MDASKRLKELLDEDEENFFSEDEDGYSKEAF